MHYAVAPQLLRTGQDPQRLHALVQRVHPWHDLLSSYTSVVPEQPDHDVQKHLRPEGMHLRPHVQARHELLACACQCVHLRRSCTCFLERCQWCLGAACRCELLQDGPKQMIAHDERTAVQGWPADAFLLHREKRMDVAHDADLVGADL